MCTVQYLEHCLKKRVTLLCCAARYMFWALNNLRNKFQFDSLVCLDIVKLLSCCYLHCTLVNFFHFSVSSKPNTFLFSLSLRLSNCIGFRCFPRSGRTIKRDRKTKTNIMKIIDMVFYQNSTYIALVVDTIAITCSFNGIHITYRDEQVAVLMIIPNITTCSNASILPFFKWIWTIPHRRFGFNLLLLFQLRWNTFNEWLGLIDKNPIPIFVCVCVCELSLPTQS